MERLTVVPAQDRVAWTEALRAAGAHDLYHLPEYHALAEERGEGAARLFVFRGDDGVIALPLLLRPLNAVPGLQRVGSGCYDASSVYGYPGPIASRPDFAPATLASFRDALADCLADMRVVAVFSRLHPLLDVQRDLLAGLGEVEPRGQTISIDLEPSPEEQLANYRQGHRYDVRRLRRQGLVVEHDETGRHLKAFIDIYHQTMRRVGATPGYFFSEGYFERLMTMRGVFHLLVCRADDRVVAGAIFGLCGSIAQYHLAGTDPEFQRLAPMKLVVDAARTWARERGATVLHLGGGLGAGEDKLFNFKAGFSTRRHGFALWRWILAPEVYTGLNGAREAYVAARGLRVGAPDFFPAYRRPILAAA